MKKDSILATLDAFQPTTAVEGEFLERTRAFVEGAEAPAARSTLAGHLTASGWLLNAECTHACLLLHGKLGRWLQPGGHGEVEDESLAAAALREVVEEAGIPPELLELGPMFDIDVHPIPERGDEPEHFHYDCRFLFRCKPDAEVIISTESEGYRWVALDELVAVPDASTRRMAEKTVGGAARAYFSSPSKASLP